MDTKKTFREVAWEAMIDELMSGQDLHVNRENLQETNEWFVEKMMLPGPVVARRKYINGKLQD